MISDGVVNPATRREKKRAGLAMPFPNDLCPASVFLHTALQSLQVFRRQIERGQKRRRDVQRVERLFVKGHHSGSVPPPTVTDTVRCRSAVWDLSQDSVYVCVSSAVKLDVDSDKV
jgi:hypothetical protein